MHSGSARQGRRAGTSQDPPGEVELARQVAALPGGRYSAELGIDVDAGEAQVERWFVAATLFGARIAAHVAERTFGVLAAAGLARIGQCTQPAAVSRGQALPIAIFLACSRCGSGTRISRTPAL